MGARPRTINPAELSGLAPAQEGRNPLIAEIRTQRGLDNAQTPDLQAQSPANTGPENNAPDQAGQNPNGLNSLVLNVPQAPAPRRPTEPGGMT